MTRPPRPTTDSSPLITVDRLRELLATDFHAAPADRPVLLDVRWALATGPDRAAFDAGHIPGARFVDMDVALAAPAGHGGRHPLPRAEDFAGAMSAADVGRDSTVVVYDAGPATAAARAWWLLRYFGHDAPVLVLDGGLAKWAAEGRPIEKSDAYAALTDAPDSAGDFRVGTPLVDTLDLDDVLAFAERGVLVDARAPERFRGDSEPIDPVGGHIPGAVNRPTTANLHDDGTFLAAEDLRRRFTALLGSPPAPHLEVAAYCGSGITAAHEVLAMAVAGYSASLYPGSWSQWVDDPARPVATGPDRPTPA